MLRQTFQNQPLLYKSIVFHRPHVYHDIYGIAILQTLLENTITPRFKNCDLKNSRICILVS